MVQNLFMHKVTEESRAKVYFTFSLLLARWKSLQGCSSVGNFLRGNFVTEIEGYFGNMYEELGGGGGGTSSPRNATSRGKTSLSLPGGGAL